MAQIFISHGHNELVRFKLKQFVTDRLGMKSVVLQDEPDLGMTIVEKLERYASDCSFALIVFTADDTTTEGGRRARQNVVHELGFFHGKLGRRRVLLLREQGVELFSNISGLIYKDFEGDQVESTFESIRMAVESNDALPFGSEVRRDTPKRSAEDLRGLFEELRDGDMPASDLIELIQWLAEGPEQESRRYLEKIAMSPKQFARAEIDAARMALDDIDHNRLCKNLAERVQAKEAKETREWDPDDTAPIPMQLIAKAMYWDRPDSAIHKTAQEGLIEILRRNPPPSSSE